MSLLRLAFLTAGPVVLVGAFYSLTLGRSVGEVAQETASVVTGAVLGNPVAPDEFEGQSARGLIPVRPAAHVRDVDLVEISEERTAGDEHASLDERCRKKGAELSLRLGQTSRFLVRPPFVLGGDLPESEMSEVHEKLVVPVARALETCYFDRRPEEPVALLMFSDDAAFQEAARRLDGKRRHDYYGYYRREDRRIMLNASSGSGTLAHELTHALAHFDFPEMPEWLDEGLAALHEESKFSDDERRLVGQQNWRVNHLLLALRRGRLRTLSELMTGPAVRPGLDAIDYAHARYFCLYLQKRDLLERFYRKLRSEEGRDAGIGALRALVEPASLDDLDRDFRAWAVTLRPVSRRSTETRRL